MKEVRIELAVEKLESDTQRARAEGIEDLKRFLSQNKGTSRLNSLDDDGFHKIFEAIFRVVRIEKPAFLRASKSTTRSATAPRLASCAAVLRLAVEIGTQKIRSKTANAVIDHITETLPVAGEGFFQPLRDDYLKTLRTVLEFPPHCEHLRKNQWQNLVDFLLDALSLRSEDNSFNINDTRQRQGKELEVTRSLQGVSQTTTFRFSRLDATKNATDEAVYCLRLVTAITNAPIISRARAIIHSVMNLLESNSSSQQAALETFNNVYSKIITEDISLARQAIFSLIPAIRRLWMSKSNTALKDQMLISLTLGKDFLVWQPELPINQAHISSLNNLFDVMSGEYYRRIGRDVLQMDDIIFCDGRHGLPLGLKTFTPNVASSRAMSNWTVVSTLASVGVISDDLAVHLHNYEQPSEPPNKRPRLEKCTDNIIHQALSSTGLERLLALQLLSFLVVETRGVDEKLSSHVQQLAAGILDDDTAIASWTMLFFACFACYAPDSNFEDWSSWTQIWNWTARTLSTPNTSRAACHLLETILDKQLLGTSDVAVMIDSTIFSDGLNGPCILTDSAISLWMTIMDARVSSSSGRAQKTSIRVVNWLGANWTFRASALDRNHNTQIAFHARADKIISLLMICIGRKLPFSRVHNSIVSSPIYLACYQKWRISALARYLLRRDPVDEDVIGQAALHSDEQLAEQTAFARDRDAILAMLLSKLKAFREVWIAISSQRASHINSDTLQSFTSLCMVVQAFVAASNAQRSVLCDEISALIKHIWDLAFTFLSQQEGESLQTCLVTVASTMLTLQSQDAHMHTVIQESLSPLVAPLLDLLQKYLDRQKAGSTSEPDIMEVEESFSTQTSQPTQESAHYDTVRADLPFLSDQNSFMTNIAIDFLTSRHLTTSEDVLDTAITSSTVDFLFTLSSSDLLACRKTILAFLSASPNMIRTDASRILKKMGEACLVNEKYERCEGSLCLCLEVMIAFATLWTSKQEDELFDIACEIYAWFLEVALGKGLASSRVLIAIANMLEAVLLTNPQFRLEDCAPSPRTSLFQILQVGDNTVKYHVARQISRIFDRFILTEHDAILDDVVDSLPTDPENIEGIALRLWVFAELASKRHTVVRRCVYHLFETAAHIPASIPYAQYCLQKVCIGLDLKSPRDVFRLFSSQILYTWLEKETISSIPFPIYDYNSLVELLADVRQELVGQISMRANVEQAESVSQQFGIPWVEMLEAAFAKTEAYTIARDISLPPLENQAKSTESQVRKQLGNPTYLDLVRNSFPQIVAFLFVSLGDDHGVERAFSKRHALSTTATALLEIRQRSHSEIILPAGQQPSFRAKYLVDELEFLCQRIDESLDSVWTPPLVTHVARALFDSAVPALGPLYACAVLRKIRLVVAFAGVNAHQDYPLEMLLHALRPYLTEFYCSEDALGIFWYLLDNGKSYLQAHPSFTAGIAVSAFASLSHFLQSPQDSTTQESHFQATMSKAKAFHGWFGKYLTEYDPTNLEPDVQAAFKRIVASARCITKKGSPLKGTHEGDLIFELVDDRTSQRCLLSRAAFDLALQILCYQFEPAPRMRDDILDLDSKAALHEPVIRDIVLRLQVGSEFKIWAAQVMGRAYAYTGKINDILTREQDSTLFQHVQVDDNLRKASYAAIFDGLRALLLAENHVETGLAEKTLQMIITKIMKTGLAEHYGYFTEQSLVRGLGWDVFPSPQLVLNPGSAEKETNKSQPGQDVPLEEWASDLALSLSLKMPDDAVIGPLPVILDELPSFAVKILPYIVHSALLSDIDNQRSLRQQVSNAFNDILQSSQESNRPHIRLLLGTMLYLRCCPIPRESTMADRDNWCELDLGKAALSAARCEMYKTALLLIELQASQSSLKNLRSLRRSSTSRIGESVELMHLIFRNVDDPDFYYGIQEQASMESVLRKLHHEDIGFKNLSFQSASYDSKIKLSSMDGRSIDASGTFQALSAANISGLARAVQANANLMDSSSISASKSVLQTALNLHQWDLPASGSHSLSTSILLKAFHQSNTLRNETVILKTIDDGLLEIVNELTSSRVHGGALYQDFAILSSLTEMKECFSSTNIGDLGDQWQIMSVRSQWMQHESFDKVSLILLGREAIFKTIKQNDELKSKIKISNTDSQSFEIKTIRESLNIARNHGDLQASLNRAMYLSELVGPYESSGFKIECAAQYDLAKILWDQGEMTSSIQMLRQLKNRDDLQQQAILISQSDLLADLGHQIAEARSEKPDEIIARYLQPAIKELKGESHSNEAGRVFHDFATFCHKQLQSSDDLDDFSRIEKIRHRKEEEVHDLEAMVRRAEGKQRDMLKSHLSKAKQWFKLDDEEYQRLRKTRESFIQQSLENYLRSLEACDKYDSDVLRFCALWFDQSGSPLANSAVAKQISSVASYKFAPLVNQLSSRILDNQDDFQLLLFELLIRICTDHPFHGMYQIFASSRSKAGKNDDVALSRYAAAHKLADKLTKQASSSKLWIAINNSSMVFVRVANEHLSQDDKRYRQGSKVRFQELKSCRQLEQLIVQSNTKIPPPSMKVPLRPDCNYSLITTFTQFEPQFTIAGGLSAPKIITIIGSDGLRYKMLLKGGNDDLRQDSIMEQVFEQVSNLLQDHRATRQRNLGIRTYKVLPLTPNAGIIEFVKDTIPLHDYLLPAHQKYYPKDFKPNRCRKDISDAQNKPLSQRLQAFRNVMNSFHPVMRYFFMERFLNPDDWFARRLAYSRSTAAISILGHILGLGDRHGHNILLDEQTGEVVHIDLGVAFEAGRILPVPEVVPFRLTRDLVDGMGLSGVEGVFRRCCNFTLEALRQDQESIMTILDVLRYDPLVSWSISPVRLQRMQENQEAAEAGGSTSTVLGGKKDINEPSEADRALTVVAKKLGKSLSVEATVNELIQQATDERNLAVLFAGWGAYA